MSFHLRPVRRVASACLAASLTMTMLAAFLLPGPSGRRPAAPAAAVGAIVVYAWTPGSGQEPGRSAGRPGRLAADSQDPPRASPQPAAPARLAAGAPASDARTPPTQAAAAVAADPVAPPAVAPTAAGAITAGLPAPLPAPLPVPVPESVPARAASAPLRLDRSVVREASRASRSSVQQMAEAAGQTAGDAPVSGSERLADSVARTVKPDCLPPGGTYGLLTPLVAAYKMATDTCRNR